MDLQIAETPKSGLSLSKHASYMIVGGLTGIGAAFARWMSQDLGATHLILLSRSGINAKGAKDLVSTLERSKTTVKVIACDVADAQDLERQLEECGKVMPPIRGVFQGAMVLQVRKAAHFVSFTLTPPGFNVFCDVVREICHRSPTEN